MLLAFLVSTDVGSCRQLIEGFGDEDRIGYLEKSLELLTQTHSYSMMKLLYDPVYWQAAQTAEFSVKLLLLGHDVLITIARSILLLLEQSQRSG